MRTSSILFLSLSLGLLPAASLSAQSAPFFDTFGYPWHTKPGTVIPKANPVLGVPSPNGAWDKVIWARGGGWPTVDYLAENVDTRLTGGKSVLVLAVTPPPSSGKAAGGAEVIHRVRRVFGSCRARLKPSPGTWNGSPNSPGVCNGFYLISSQVEIDMEFLSIAQGRKPGRGQFEIVIHDYTFKPGNRLSFRKSVPLPFDPSREFHEYGFDWYPGYVEFFVDGKKAAVVRNGAQGRINVPPWVAGITFPAAGKAVPAALRLNNWTDLWGWCGPPPSKRMEFQIDWICWSPLYFGSDANEISLTSGGRAGMSLLGGPGRKGSGYLVLSSPLPLDRGLQLAGLGMPLELDLSLTPLLLSLANSSFFPGFLGLLDGAGRAAPAFVIPAGLSPSLAGTAFRFCPLLFDAATGALGPWGNPLTVTLR